MPRKGPAFPISRAWQGWVLERIEHMKEDGEVRSQNDVARLAGISPASLSEALKDGAIQTTVMPQIHKALSWPPPLITPPIHVLRMAHYFMSLPELEQGQQLERLRARVEAEREAARVDRDRSGAVRGPRGR